MVRIVLTLMMLMLIGCSSSTKDLQVIEFRWASQRPVVWQVNKFLDATSLHVIDVDFVGNGSSTVCFITCTK